MGYISETEKESRREKCLNDFELIKKFDSIVVYDLETSGLDAKKDRILQFSGIRFSLPDFEELDRRDIYIKSPFSIPEKITEINHIDDALLEEKGLDDFDAYKIMSEFIRPDDLISGYNIVSFDNNFMETFYKLFGKTFEYKAVVDGLVLARLIVDPESVMGEGRGGKARPHYNLKKISEYYGMKEGEIEYHNSIEDVKATGYVLKHIFKDIEEKYVKAPAEPKAELGKRIANIQSINWWPAMERIYINTDQGSYYYDSKRKKWDAKPGHGNLLSINIEQLIADVFTAENVTSEDELVNAVKRKYKKTA